MKEKAIELIALIEKMDAEYRKINGAMALVQGDFHSNIEIMNHNIYSAVASLLDEILGDETASYYLFECLNMKGGGSVYEDGKKYPLRNIEDLRAYVLRK